MTICRWLVSTVWDNCSVLKRMPYPTPSRSGRVRREQTKVAILSSRTGNGPQFGRLRHVAFVHSRIQYLLPGSLETHERLVGVDTVFQGAMVSTMIFIPAIALSISPCTRPTSDLRNSCSC